MKVKVCGITNIADAEAAIKCGADYIGLVFVEGTPRCVDLDQAKAIAKFVGKRAQVVGVFQDQVASAIEKTAKLVRLDMIQLHGSESPELCSAIGLPVIKALSPLLVKGKISEVEHFVAEIELYRSHCRHILIDKRKTVIDPDWLALTLPNLAEIEGTLGEYFLAGGLNDGVAEMVIEAVHPFCLDLSSAIEISPGKKNHQLMAKFFETVRSQSKGPVLGEANRC
jgi:phosphoribosylanthranilate isomerase